MKLYLTIVSLLLPGVCGMAAYGQQGGDILSDYRPGNQFYPGVFKFFLICFNYFDSIN